MPPPPRTTFRIKVRVGGRLKVYVMGQVKGICYDKLVFGAG